MPFEVTDDDFTRLRAWRQDPDGLAAVRDYHPAKALLRWIKPSHRARDREYRARRAGWVTQRSFEQYFKDEDRSIDRRRWEYLKERKAWYILPLGWDHFAGQDVRRILDLGCGDGDVTQRVADWIVRAWRARGIAPHPLEIVGVDLGQSRIKNARAYCTAPDPNITFTFVATDATKGLPYPARHFDHAVCSGVLEILDDMSARLLAKTLCEVTDRGLHIEDLVDRYPGGFPRPDLAPLIEPHGFRIRERVVVLTEPFSLFADPDPARLWPILRDQSVWAERVAGAAG